MNKISDHFPNCQGNAPLIYHEQLIFLNWGTLTYAIFVVKEDRTDIETY